MQKQTVRVGIGYDIHRLVRKRPLWLGGVHIPFAKGLQGHSDADVLLHAIIDALLGAAGLPDIGHYFPPSDAKLRGLSSSVMVKKAASEVRRLGFTISNIDSIVVAEEPKIAPHREAMRRTIARLLAIPTASIQVKGKTNEGLDAVGRGHAMAAHAVVLLEKRH